MFPIKNSKILFKVSASVSYPLHWLQFSIPRHLLFEGRGRLMAAAVKTSDHTSSGHCGKTRKGKKSVKAIKGYFER